MIIGPLTVIALWALGALSVAYLLGWHRGYAEGAASADTHPKDGDVQQAPLVSGAVPERQTPNSSHSSTGDRE
jgi:hypothetical protein